MTDFLVRHFIRDYQSVEKAAVRTTYGIFASVVGIICNTFLFLVKFLLGGRYRSEHSAVSGKMDCRIFKWFHCDHCGCI